eukprot:9205292-Pyramimonas_sp.AAC.1
MGLVCDLSGARGPRQARLAQPQRSGDAIRGGAGRGGARAISGDKTAAAHTKSEDRKGRRRGGRDALRGTRNNNMNLFGKGVNIILSKLALTSARLNMI